MNSTGQIDRKLMSLSIGRFSLHCTISSNSFCFIMKMISKIVIIKMIIIVTYSSILLQCRLHSLIGCTYFVGLMVLGIRREIYFGDLGRC